MPKTLTASLLCLALAVSGLAAKKDLSDPAPAPSSPEAAAAPAVDAAKPAAEEPKAAGVGVSKAAAEKPAVEKKDDADSEWSELAAKAANGDPKAYAEISKAIEGGSTEASEALAAAQNLKLVKPLKAKAVAGDLGSVKKLLDLREKKNQAADAALLEAYEALAPKAAAGDEMASLVLEYAAKKGDKRVQAVLDKHAAPVVDKAPEAPKEDGQMKEPPAEPAADAPAADVPAKELPPAADAAPAAKPQASPKTEAKPTGGK